MPRQPYSTINGNNSSTNPPPFGATRPLSRPICICVCCEPGEIVWRITEPCLNLVETGSYVLITNELNQNDHRVLTEYNCKCRARLKSSFVGGPEKTFHALVLISDLVHFSVSRLVAYAAALNTPPDTTTVN